MTFRSTDLYLTSGSSTLINNWVEPVTKFDTSNFYNWEQDNEPIHDLEDRTFFNWEKGGYSSSSIPGMCFLVSGGANVSANIFNDVSSCINALPDVIRFPIIIEIARFGDLGKLHLKNFKIVENGGLEIINRCYGKFYSASSVAKSVTADTKTGYFHPGAIKSADLSSTIANTSAMCTSTLVFSATGDDSRFEANNAMFVAIPGYESGGNKRTENLHFSRNDTGIMVSSNEFSLSEYETGDGGGDDTINLFDTSTFNKLNNAVVKRTDPADVDPVGGLVFGNHFTEVVVENCDGPLYIRNVLVDGGSGANGTLVYTTRKGFQVRSSDVVIENCAVVRCRDAGFAIDNSKVTLSRGVIAHRNYDLDATDNRNTSAVTPGLLANNSHLTVSSHQYASGTDLLMMFSRNEIGVELINSQLDGGDGRGTTDGTTYFQTFFNNRSGLKLRGSTVNLNGRLDTFNNDVGVDSENSQILLDEITVEANQSEGMLLKQTAFVYGKAQLPLGVNSIASMEQFFCSGNGQHLNLEHSSMWASYASSMPNKHGQFLLQNNHGRSNSVSSQKVSVPAIELDNSYANLIHTRIETANGNDYGGDSAVFGAAIAANNNSVVELQGSKSVANIILGPNNRGKQVRSAGVFAGNNSEIKVQGPTLIAQFGVDLLAEDGSVITASPHKRNRDDLDVSGWNLTDADNHTKLELHSTRAGIVVNRNSVLNLFDMGDVHNFWAESLTSAIDYNKDNEFVLSAVTTSGYVQFWANPYGPGGVHDVSSVADTFNSNGHGLLNPLIPAVETVDNYTRGGVCVRAVNNSEVYVRNVHFPAGWYNASGMIFDSSSGTCERLYIWNIADNSKLHASLMSVSGLYPSLAGYHGPSALYAGVAAAVTSGAPNSTPGTSSLSILDKYGKGGHIGTGLVEFYGQDSFLNSGPFRLFFGVKGPGKMLGYTVNSVLEFGMPYQQLSQGYNLSATASSLTNLGTLYNELSATNLPVFYHTSATLPHGIRVITDESGADSFANARNCTENESGKIAVVTIYRSLDKRTGEGHDADNASHGKGYYSSNVFDLTRDN